MVVGHYCCRIGSGRAGTPPQTSLAGIVVLGVATAPASKIAPACMVVPGMTTAFTPTVAPGAITIGASMMRPGVMA